MTQATLAERAKVGLSTIKNFEAGRSMPLPKNMDDIERVFGESGIQFAVRGEGEEGSEYSVTLAVLKKGKRAVVLPRLR